MIARELNTIRCFVQNVLSNYNCTSSSLPHLRDQKERKILNPEIISCIEISGLPEFPQKEKATSKYWKHSSSGNFQFIQFLYEYFSLEWFVFWTGKNRSVNQMSETYKFPRILGVSHAMQNGYSQLESGESEVYSWLSSISQGLNLQRLAAEFERRGFQTKHSLFTAVYGEE